MKKLILLTISAMLTLPTLAQDDDMYFVPTKENVAKEKKSWGMPRDTYYSGSHRSVDDYNRPAYSAVAHVDSAGNDIIDFSAVRGTYPKRDSLSAYTDSGSDYKYTRRMSRFDDYSPSEAYWDGYRDGRWSSPWYYTAYYSPWYDPWYDPWYGPYYSYWGYYRPAYYYGYYGYPRYYGWAYPRRIYYSGTRYVSRPVRPVNHRPTYRSSGGSFGGSRSFSTGGSFGGYRGSSSIGGGSFGGGRSGGGGGRAGGGRSFGGYR